MSNAEKSRHRILTIPNVLSFLRVCMIPFIIWLYCFKKNYPWTTVLLILSWLTDVVDGFIARRFDMVSEFGKAFDPVADKLTQIAMMFCLVTRFPNMLIPLAILVVKEIFAGIMGLILIRRNQEVMGADWHGKLTTGFLYSSMILHIAWFNIPSDISNILIALCTAMMLLSAVLYTIRNIRAIKIKTEEM